MARKIICDVCGREMPSGLEVWARLRYRTVLKGRTAKGRETVKKIVRSVDLCSPDCFRKFRVEPEAEVLGEVFKHRCESCGRAFPSERALKIHRTKAHR